MTRNGRDCIILYHTQCLVSPFKTVVLSLKKQETEREGASVSILTQSWIVPASSSTSTTLVSNAIDVTAAAKLSIASHDNYN